MIFYPVIQYISHHREQLFRFFIVGVSSAILDMALLIFFREVLLFHPVVAVAVGQTIVLVFNFTLNKHWSFQSTNHARSEAIRYACVVGMNYLAALGIMYIGYSLLQFDYRLVRIANIALAAVANFFAYKYWVYKTTSQLIHTDEHPIPATKNDV